ncbi:MAG: hypothetical protein HKO08_00945 [Erythrobacter sp.]|nr:hypothetical protein [Erythrobacter sp.]
MAKSFAFGPARSPPVVTYGASQPARQNVRSQDTGDSRSLARNIAGIVTPAAALTLGIIAFASSTGVQKSEAPGRDTSRASLQGPPRTPVRVELAPSPVTLPVEEVAPGEALASFPVDTRSSPIAAFDPDMQEAWQPADTQSPREQMIARADASVEVALSEFSSAAAIQPVEPRGFAETTPAVAFANRAKAKDLIGANYETGLVRGSPLIELEVESAMARLPDTARSPESDIEFIRRDYSRTVQAAGITRDIPIIDEEGLRLQRLRETFRPDMQRVGEMREKLSALRNAHPRSDYARNTHREQQDAEASFDRQGVSGTVARDDVIETDGKLAWVRLGAVLEVVETRMPPDEYAAMASSNHAGAFVSTTTLKKAGLAAAYDGRKAELSLASTS